MWILIIGWVLKSCGYSKRFAGTQNSGCLNSGNPKLGTQNLISVDILKFVIIKTLCWYSNLWVLKICCGHKICR